MPGAGGRRVCVPPRSRAVGLLAGAADSQLSLLLLTVLPELPPGPRVPHALTGCPTLQQPPEPVGSQESAEALWIMLQTKEDS